MPLATHAHMNEDATHMSNATRYANANRQLHVNKNTQDNHTLIHINTST